MVLTIKVPLKDANKLKNILIKGSNLKAGYKIRKEKNSIFFPINKK